MLFEIGSYWPHYFLGQWLKQKDANFGSQRGVEFLCQPGQTAPLRFAQRVVSRRAHDTDGRFGHLDDFVLDELGNRRAIVA